MKKTIKLEKITKDRSFFLFSEDKIFFYDHHRCHATYGLFASGQLGKKLVVVTADGNGDDTNGSIWVYNKKDFSQVYKTKR